MTTASSKAEEEGFYILHTKVRPWMERERLSPPRYCISTEFFTSRKKFRSEKPPKDSTGSEHFYGGILALYGTNAQLNKLLL
jgi:hypothetical protein